MTTLWLCLGIFIAAAVIAAVYGLCALLAVHNINRRDE